MKVITGSSNGRAVQIGVFSSLLVFGLASGPLSAQQNSDAQQRQQSAQAPAQPGQEQQAAAGGPNVTVREQPPQVQVEQSAPQVGVAPTKHDEQQQQPGQQAQAKPQPTPSQQPANVAQLQHMKGKPLYSQSGQELGKIDELARDKTTGKTVAIVSTGGFLGVGGEKVAVPVENIQVEGDRAVTASVNSKEELKQMATAGTEQYEKLGGGRSSQG